MKYRYSLCIAFFLLIGCGPSDTDTPTGVSHKLLELHGLVGVTPAERPGDRKRQAVSRADLWPLFVDLRTLDPFIGDLYMGVVLGALAHNQFELYEDMADETAVVRAGTLDIHLDLTDNGWKINLGKTIPSPLKKRAKMEKRRYDAARVMGQALKEE